MARTERMTVVANDLAAWIDAQPIVKDEQGNPTISPVYGAHVLLCDLIRESESAEREKMALIAERDALKAQVEQFIEVRQDAYSRGYKDGLTAPKTRWVISRLGDSKREISLGLADRLTALHLTASLETLPACPQCKVSSTAIGYHCDKLAEKLAAHFERLALGEQGECDNGNLFVFCDYIDARPAACVNGHFPACVRGAGHNGPHALSLPPHPQNPVRLVND